ncbi:MAG: hypothetical protein MUF23_14920 [Pirellula sp.]|nr:hypothetical protein [Pirellula sp.]
MIQSIKTTTEHEHRFIGLSTSTNEQPEQVAAPKDSVGSVPRGDEAPPPG